MVADRSAIQRPDTEAMDRGAIHDYDDDNPARSNQRTTGVTRTRNHRS